MGIFFEEKTPFADVFFENIAQLTYPKDKIDIIIHYAVSSLGTTSEYIIEWSAYFDCFRFILTRILCSTIEYYCINMVLYKLINIYINPRGDQEKSSVAYSSYTNQNFANIGYKNMNESSF